MFIQNGSDYPYTEVPTPYSVMPGIGVNFIVDRSFYKQHPAPYSDCTVDENNELVANARLDSYELFDAFKHSNYSYSQASCIRFCTQMNVSSVCGCTMFKIDYQVANVNHCLTAAQYECAEKAGDAFVSSGLVNSVCLPMCPLECEKKTTHAAILPYKYPYSTIYVSEAISPVADFVNQTDFSDNLVDNLVQFSVYYDTLAYTLVEEEPKMTADDLFGTLGGHLHLFMGMSLLSFVEIAELMLLFVLKIKIASSA